jgi:hypothetical protein
VRRPTTRRGWLTLGCGGLLALFLLCGVVASLTGGASSLPTSTPVVQAPTIAPSVEPPAPTEEALPTVDSSSADRMAVHTYFVTVGPKLTTFGDALSGFAAQMQTPDLADDAWKIRTAAAIAVMQLTHEELRTLGNVPPPVQPLHTQLVDATKDCADAGAMIGRAIDVQSTALVQEAVVVMQRCNTKLTEARPTLDAFMAEYGPTP